MRKNIYKYGRKMNEGADCCAEQISQLRDILIGKEYWNDETNEDGIPGIIDDVTVAGNVVTVAVLEDDGYIHRERNIVDVLDCVDLTDEEDYVVQDALRCIEDQDCDDDVEYRESKRDRQISKADAISRIARELPESVSSPRQMKKANESYDDSFLKDLLIGAQCYDDDGVAGRNGENGEIIDVKTTNGCPTVVVDYDGKIYNGKLSDCIDYIVLSARDRAALDDYLANCDECLDECGIEECGDKEYKDKDRLFSARRAKNECGSYRKPRVNESVATRRKRLFTAMNIRERELKKDRIMRLHESASRMNRVSSPRRIRTARNRHI